MLINTEGFTDPRTGAHVDTTVDTSDLRWGKFNCPMAVYLDACATAGMEDEWTGNSDIGESTLLFGKWLLSYDDQGFVEAYKYASRDAAVAEFDRIEAVFAAMEEGEEDE